MKALLMNIFVCPGGGHIMLGKKALGWSILAVSAFCLTLMMSDILSVSQQVAEDILAGKLALDPASLSAEVHQQLLTMNLGWPLWGLVISWAVGIIDSLRLLTAHHQQAV